LEEATLEAEMKELEKIEEEKLNKRKL